MVWPCFKRVFVSRSICHCLAGKRSQQCDIVGIEELFNRRAMTHYERGGGEPANSDLFKTLFGDNRYLANPAISDDPTLAFTFRELMHSEKPTETVYGNHTEFGRSLLGATFTQIFQRRLEAIVGRKMIGLIRNPFFA
jgi:hypothetical protein